MNDGMILLDLGSLVDCTNLLSEPDDGAVSHITVV